MHIVDQPLRLGTLGSAATFAGEAAMMFVAEHPGFVGPNYFPSMEACWDALEQCRVDAVLMGVERTGQPHHGDAVVERNFFVAASLDSPLACVLYGRADTVPQSVRKIVGHGSIKQCTGYLQRHYPGVPLEMHALNSVEAARAVVAGDGSTLVVGSRSLPSEVPGLRTIASCIDDGARARWWVITRCPQFVARPTTVIVSGTFDADGRLGQCIGALTERGLMLSISAAFATADGLSRYRYLLEFRGPCDRAAIDVVCQQFSCRLVGAYC